MCTSSKNISDGAARLGTILFTNGFFWGSEPRNHAYYHVLRQTLADRELNFFTQSLSKFQNGT